MNTNHYYSVLVLLKYLCWNALFTQLMAIPKVKFDIDTTNKNTAYAKYLANEQRRYLYLNYKEAYGLRFNPKTSDKRQNTSNELHAKPSWDEVSAEEDVDTTTTKYAGITMVSNSLMNITIETTTIASPSTTQPSTFIDDKVSLTDRTLPNKRHTLASASLRYQIDATIPQNTTDQMPITATATTTEASSSSTVPSTTTIASPQPQKSSSLRDTLDLLRTKFKQWLTFGGDKKPPLISGQRFLSVFNLIQFDNSPCTPTQEGLSDMSGICYQDYQCEQMGGTSVDECADGLGVCCICKQMFCFFCILQIFEFDQEI